jgi:hypothetical protein
MEVKLPGQLLLTPGMRPGLDDLTFYSKFMTHEKCLEFLKL